MVHEPLRSTAITSINPAAVTAADSVGGRNYRGAGRRDCHHSTICESVQLRRVDAFVPALITGILITSLITSTLLFSIAIVRQKALLVLASGYFIQR